jgi:uncharacterized protein (UPF0332 family)
MSKATLAGRLLDVAELLLTESNGSSAYKRRAVSTAYYAVFHALDKVCADYISHSAKRSSDEYLRVYRALDHAPLKNAFSQPPLKDDLVLSKIGSAVVTLQNERHRADYLPPISGVFTLDRATQLIGMAKEAVNQIESLKLGAKERQTLALSLIFKERRS